MGRHRLLPIWMRCMGIPHPWEGIAYSQSGCIAWEYPIHGKASPTPNLDALHGNTPSMGRHRLLPIWMHCMGLPHPWEGIAYSQSGCVAWEYPIHGKASPTPNLDALHGNTPSMGRHRLLPIWMHCMGIPHPWEGIAYSQSGCIAWEYPIHGKASPTPNLDALHGNTPSMGRHRLLPIWMRCMGIPHPWEGIAYSQSGCIAWEYPINGKASPTPNLDALHGNTPSMGRHRLLPIWMQGMGLPHPWEGIAYSQSGCIAWEYPIHGKASPTPNLDALHGTTPSMGRHRLLPIWMHCMGIPHPWEGIAYSQSGCVAWEYPIHGKASPTPNLDALHGNTPSMGRHRLLPIWMRCMGIPHPWEGIAYSQSGCIAWEYPIHGKASPTPNLDALHGTTPSMGRHRLLPIWMRCMGIPHPWEGIAYSQSGCVAWEYPIHGKASPTPNLDALHGNTPSMGRHRLLPIWMRCMGIPHPWEGIAYSQSGCIAWEYPIHGKASPTPNLDALHGNTPSMGRHRLLPIWMHCMGIPHPWEGIAYSQSGCIAWEYPIHGKASPTPNLDALHGNTPSMGRHRLLPIWMRCMGIPHPWEGIAYSQSGCIAWEYPIHGKASPTPNLDALHGNIALQQR